MGVVDRSQIVDDLNRLMAEELEACLRYFQMRFGLREKDCLPAQQFLEDAVDEAMEHATAIAEQIRSLGQIPTLRVTLSLAGDPLRLEAALAEALEVEQQALDAYKDLLPRITGYAVLEAFIQRQVEVETEHVQGIRDFIRASAAMKLVARKHRE